MGVWLEVAAHGDAQGDPSTRSLASRSPAVPALHGCRATRPRPRCDAEAVSGAIPGGYVVTAATSPARPDSHLTWIATLAVAVLRCPTQNTTDANKALTCHIIGEIESTRNPGIIDEIYAPSPEGYRGTRQFVAAYLAAFPDLHKQR